MPRKAAKRVLAFGCHPDDVEFQCAGTLALLAGLGCQVHVATMAGGEVGSAELPPQKIRQVRLAEAARSAAVIGAEFTYAGGYDLEVEYNADYRRRAVRVLREVDPDVVFTHPPMDYLGDHEETSRLVRFAAFIAPVPNFDCGVVTRPTTRVPHLYYWNAAGRRDIFGRPLPLSTAVDVSGAMRTKSRMLACHASQRQWLKQQHGYDRYLDVMRAHARQEGRPFGLKAAEGFIQHRGEGYPQDNILKTLLGELCVDI